MAQMWPVYHPTGIPEHHEAHRSWDSYDFRASVPRGSRLQGPISVHRDVTESSYEKVTSWADKCRSQPYTSNSDTFYQQDHAVYAATLEDGYRHLPHAYDFG